MNFLRYCLIAPVIVSGALFPLSSYAETVEPYVVTASRFEQQINQVGSDVTVITAEELKEKQITNLGEALRHVPGVQIAQSGNLTGVYAYGSKSTAVLILIDGIPITDTTAYNVDPSTVFLANAERIEVVLGAQSAMYGANALSGVINIVTKKGDGPATGSILVGAGYPSIGILQAQASAGAEKYSWAFGVTANTRNQVSAQNDNDERDASDEFGFNGSLTYKPTATLSIHSNIYSEYQRLEYDPNDNVGHVFRNLFNIKPELSLFDGAWIPSLNLSYTNADRQYYEYGGKNSYESQSIRADWLNKFSFDIHNVALGFEYHYDEQLSNPYAAGKENDESNSYAVYAEYSINPIDSFFITLAGRLDKNERYDLEPSASISAAYTLESTNTTFHASAGKAYKAPSISDYASNKDVKPESSYTWDIGVTQPIINNIAEINISYFQAQYEDALYLDFSTTPTTTYNSKDSIEAQGVKLAIQANPIDELSLNLAGVWQDTHDTFSDKRQARQADLQVNFDIDYLLPIEAKDVYVGASVTYVDDRDDTNYNVYPSSAVTLDAYTTVDLRAKVYLEENLALSLKLNNIFDEEYEEVYGYNTLGFNGFASIEYTF